MPAFVSTISLLSLSAVTFTPPTVPAAGRQEVLLKVDAPGMVRFSAQSPAGTACTVVDRVRGPFASAGAVGGTSCLLDLLLDAGEYKVRLESPRRGKGSVQLAATPFPDVQAAPLRLTAGTALSTKVKLGQQVSAWLSLDAAATPYVRVAGRNAGDVRLWRNGQWLEPVSFKHTQLVLGPGKPIHEWWLDTQLEAGEYQLVVYGKDPARSASGGIDDTVTLSMGFPAAPATQALRFTIPEGGLAAVEVGNAPLTAVLSLAKRPEAPVELAGVTMTGNGPLSLGASCRIDGASLSGSDGQASSAAARATECAIFSTSTASRRVLWVKGPPGTSGVLEWTTQQSSGLRRGGYYGGPTATLGFGAGTTGPHLIALHDVPLDVDGPPLGCAVYELSNTGSPTQVLARTATKIGDGKQLSLDFNYDGSGAVVWFEVTSGGRFRAQGLGGRKSRCELYRMDGVALKRLSESKPNAITCDETAALTPGLYQLQLFGGNEGIEKLVVRDESAKTQTDAVPLRTCVLPNVALRDRGHYQLVLSHVGTASARGLVIAPQPLGFGSALHLAIDGQAALELPVGTGAFTVRPSGGTVGCRLKNGTVAASGGDCVGTASADDTLTLTNGGKAPVAVTLLPKLDAVEAKPLASYSPKVQELPKLVPGAPAFFDFGRNESRSVVVEVDKPGLYNVTTEGLLSTTCWLRTPVIAEFAKDASTQGRGRNCLVQSFLQPGRYLFTAKTTGRSTGRGALSLSRRAAKDVGTVGGGGEAFFRVDSGELVQQKLVVPKAGTFELSTTSQGQSLACRLDDPQGWPVDRVPTSCTQSREFTAGSYLWTQWPLTVESMRRTQLKQTRTEKPLTGNRAHAVDFFHWYRAELGPDGKDEFTFELVGDAELDVVLSGGMQGRLYLLDGSASPKAVEVIPPMVVSEGAPPEEGEGAGEGEGEYENPRESEGERDCGDEGCGDAEPSTPAVEPMTATAAPPPPSGTKVSLAAGKYKLVAEHARGDVGIEYQLHLGSATLLPGMTRTVPTPTAIPVSVPRAGTLRLKTTGDADVRCRLFDAANKLVLDNGDNGTDWNCATAEPLPKGSYTLVIESETQQRGETAVSLALPAIDDKGAASDGLKLPLGAPVVTLGLPATADAVHELVVQGQGKTPFSCAVEDATGALVARRSRVTSCSFMVHSKGAASRLRLWTTDGVATVQLALKPRAIVQGGGEVGAANAVLLTVPKAGRYQTSGQVMCLPAGAGGVFERCGPEVSLEAGPTLFSGFGAVAHPLPLTELPFTPQDAPVAAGLSKRPLLQWVKAPTPSVFFLRSAVPFGERAGPACRFDGAGAVSEARATECFAVSAKGSEALARTWAVADADVPAQVLRRAVSWPTSATTLGAGRLELTLTQPLLLTLPGPRTRVELTVSPETWVAQLDPQGRATDLCAPTTELGRCLFTGAAGEQLLVDAPKGSRAVLAVTTLETAPKRVDFGALHEELLREPGTLKLKLAADPAPRGYVVEPALGCTLVLADNTRVSGCRGTVPAGTSAELIVEHGAGALRAFTFAPGKEAKAKLAVELPLVPGASLPFAVAAPLQAGRTDRTLVLDKDGVLRVTAESGVCGLFRGTELIAVSGLDGGCELVRLVTAGSYRLLVRPFAAMPMTGSVRATMEALDTLSEGVGAEQWLAPGDVRLFRFATQAKGRVGFGVQAKSELLECATYTDKNEPLGSGCHQYLALDKGSYVLTVRNPPGLGAKPIAFRPVLLGLTGDMNEIPETYLNDFFRRIGSN